MNIIDTVEYYGGSYFVSGKHEEHHTHIVYSNLSNSPYSVYASDIGSNPIICTIEEYNKCIDMLIGDPLKLIIWKESNNLNLDKPVTSPIYTQSMADAGVLPLVGMECLMSLGEEVWFKYRVDFIGKVYTVGFWFDKNREASFGLQGVIFKPLTPPIELVDGEAYQFKATLPNKIETVNGVFRGTNRRMYTPYGDYDLDECTNIKPLTVEGES
jgi:hypothetical protein